MWADAQRDGRPAEYVAPSVHRRKVWLTPITRVTCSKAAKTRHPLKFAVVPQWAKVHHIISTCGRGIAV